MAMLPTSGLAADSRNLAALRSEAARDPKTAAKEAAKQFEAIFMQELLKSMRAASAASAGLASISPPSATVVSAASTGMRRRPLRATTRCQPASALRCVTRRT